MVKTTHSIELGKTYLFRTVTYHFIGKVKDVTDTDVVFDGPSCWLADSGRFGDAIAKGSISEGEALPDGWAMARGGLIDFGPWEHKIPSTV